MRTLEIFGPASLVTKIKKAPRLTLFLDYDGTLADFAKTPDDIHPDKKLIDLLQTLIDNPRIEPAIISGRRLGHIQQLIPLSGLWLAGTYGIELQAPDGSLINRADYQQVRPGIEQLKPRWETVIGNHHGFYIEDKGWSLALHGKDADQANAAAAFTAAKEYAQQVVRNTVGLKVLGGERFLEVAPDAANKALAVEFLCEKIAPHQSLIVYIGDDDKDEAAFGVIIEKQGIPIKVQKEPCTTSAPLRLKSPKDVRKFLLTLT